MGWEPRCKGQGLDMSLALAFVYLYTAGALVTAMLILKEMRKDPFYQGDDAELVVLFVVATCWLPVVGAYLLLCLIARIVPRR
jgi:hypothetical protein